MVYLLYMGIKGVFGKPTANENDTQVLQRQLKGFGYLSLIGFVGLVLAAFSNLLAGNAAGVAQSLVASAVNKNWRCLNNIKKNVNVIATVYSLIKK